MLKILINEDLLWSNWEFKSDIEYLNLFIVANSRQLRKRPLLWTCTNSKLSSNKWFSSIKWLAYVESGNLLFEKARLCSLLSESMVLPDWLTQVLLQKIWGSIVEDAKSAQYPKSRLCSYMGHSKDGRGAKHQNQQRCWTCSLPRWLSRSVDVRNQREKI